MSFKLLLVFVVIIAITDSVKASLCSAKCDEILFLNVSDPVPESRLWRPRFRGFLMNIGAVQEANKLKLKHPNHSICMQKCAEYHNKNNVCKRHCDDRFGLNDGRFKVEFKVAPSGVVEDSEKLGVFFVDNKSYEQCIQEHHKQCITEPYQECITDCITDEDDYVEV